MSKQIIPVELVTIIRALLVDPDSVGELCDQKTYLGFRARIVQLLNIFDVPACRESTNEQLSDFVAEVLHFPSTAESINTLASYLEKMQQLGEAVADYCGGEITGASGPDFHPGSFSGEVNEINRETMLPMLGVIANDSLPDMENNIWSPYDKEGELFVAQSFNEQEIAL